jgi:hypothetical protein
VIPAISVFIMLFPPRFSCQRLPGYLPDAQSLA